MKTTSILFLAGANLVASHATFQWFEAGGKQVSNAVRVPSDGNNPIKDVTSPQMICKGGKPAAADFSAAAGSMVTMQWHQNNPATPGGDDPLASSHKGPIMVYMAPAASNGNGAVWTKIYEAGYANGKWATDGFIAAKGAMTVKIPASLKAGKYLIRPEIIALHEANRQGGAQFYNGCGQIDVTGSGATPLPAGVDMTKAYKATDPGVLTNIYSGAINYKIPGPAVWNGGKMRRHARNFSS